MEAGLEEKAPIPLEEKTALGFKEGFPSGQCKDLPCQNDTPVRSMHQAAAMFLTIEQRRRRAAEVDLMALM